jgi:hypothetical protein
LKSFIDAFPPAGMPAATATAFKSRIRAFADENYLGTPRLFLQMHQTTMEQLLKDAKLGILISVIRDLRTPTRPVAPAAPVNAAPVNAAPVNAAPVNAAPQINGAAGEGEFFHRRQQAAMNIWIESGMPADKLRFNDSCFFCGLCDPDLQTPNVFDVPQRFKNHITSQKHLQKVNQHLLAVVREKRPRDESDVEVVVPSESDVEVDQPEVSDAPEPEAVERRCKHKCKDKAACGHGCCK